MLNEKICTVDHDYLSSIKIPCAPAPPLLYLWDLFTTPLPLTNGGMDLRGYVYIYRPIYLVFPLFWSFYLPPPMCHFLSPNIRVEGVGRSK